MTIAPTFATEDMQSEDKQLEEQYLCSEGYTSNLREEPNLDAPIVTKLSKYTPLIKMEKKDKWTKVRTANFEGWIYNTLVEKNLDCVTSLKSYKTHTSYTSNSPHRFRKKVLTGEGFKVLKTELGMTQVKDKTGNVFWLENHVLWPKDHLQSLSL